MVYSTVLERPCAPVAQHIPLRCLAGASQAFGANISTLTGVTGEMHGDCAARRAHCHYAYARPRQCRRQMDRGQVRVASSAVNTACLLQDETSVNAGAGATRPRVMLPTEPVCSINFSMSDVLVTLKSSVSTCS